MPSDLSPSTCYSWGQASTLVIERRRPRWERGCSATTSTRRISCGSSGSGAVRLQPRMTQGCRPGLLAGRPVWAFNGSLGVLWRPWRLSFGCLAYCFLPLNIFAPLLGTKPA